MNETKKLSCNSLETSDAKENDTETKCKVPSDTAGYGQPVEYHVPLNLQDRQFSFLNTMALPEPEVLFLLLMTQ